ncbi:MAG: rhodanese-like domain-containing protein [Candidatus Acidoferrales bacterium]|nr:rhodanese-like domain-containing protein [Candidatus Acidoferrales bacterium]
MADDLPGNIEVTPREVSERLERGDKFLFVDVREKWEHETARIEGAVLIPLREIPANLPHLAEAREIVFFCHHGMRSLDAAAWLRSQGVEGARSMSGGIDRWTTEVDPLVPRY